MTATMLALALNGATTLTVPQNPADLEAFFDSIALNAGYLAADSTSTVIDVELPMGRSPRDPIDKDKVNA